MNELRRLKRGMSTKRGDDHHHHHGPITFDEWEEQQPCWHSPRELPPVIYSPRAPPVSPTGSPRTPGGSLKKPVLGKVKNKAKKWMHLLHYQKKKPMQEELMWTPRAEDIAYIGELYDARIIGTPSSAHYKPSFGEPEHEPEEFMEASPRQNSPAPSPSAQQDHPFFKISSRFESEMKDANEMLMESKQLRVKTSKNKSVKFAPILECGSEKEKSSWSNNELSKTATDVFRDSYAAVHETAHKMVSAIQETMVAHNVDRRHIVEKVISVNRYLMLKLEPGQDDEELAQVITEAVLNLSDAWSDSVERPLMQRAKKISSWFIQEKIEELHPVPLSTHPWECEEELYSL